MPRPNESTISWKNWRRSAAYSRDLTKAWWISTPRLPGAKCCSAGNWAKNRSNTGMKWTPALPADRRSHDVSAVLSLFGLFALDGWRVDHHVAADPIAARYTGHSRRSLPDPSGSVRR